jgi:hypothetical protein
MMILDKTGLFECGQSPLGLADDYRNYNSPLDKYIECDFLINDSKLRIFIGFSSLISCACSWSSKPDCQCLIPNSFSQPYSFVIRHIIIQMMILDETGIFDCGHSPLGLADDYRNYNSPLDKFIECDFSTFMASTASKWHKPEALNIFWVDIIRGKKQNFDLTYNDIHHLNNNMSEQSKIKYF